MAHPQLFGHERILLGIFGVLLDITNMKLICYGGVALLECYPGSFQILVHCILSGSLQHPADTTIIRANTFEVESKCAVPEFGIKTGRPAATNLPSWTRRRKLFMLVIVSMLWPEQRADTGLKSVLRPLGSSSVLSLRPCIFWVSYTPRAGPLPTCSFEQHRSSCRGVRRTAAKLDRSYCRETQRYQREGSGGHGHVTTSHQHSPYYIPSSNIPRSSR